MDYLRILTGKEKPLPIYKGVVVCLENPLAFHDMLGPVYREAMNLDDDTLDRFRFSLMRLQLYADLHRNEDLETAMNIKVRCTGPGKGNLWFPCHGTRRAFRRLIAPDHYPFIVICYALVIPICADPSNTWTAILVERSGTRYR